MKNFPINQIIIGTHSILAAIKNPNRICLELVATDDGMKSFLKTVKMSKQDISNKVNKVSLLDAHQFQESAKKNYGNLGFEYQKLSAGIFLIAKTLPQIKWNELVKASTNGILVALDQVTDIHNASAIIRTCAFYGVKGLIVEFKGSFSMSPSLLRIASGGIESVPIMTTNNLSATLVELKKNGVKVCGLSEEGKDDLNKITSGQKDKNQICVVFGSEDRGISNAVERELDHNLCIRPSKNSNINSLNVSVAVAITLDRLCTSSI